MTRLLIFLDLLAGRFIFWRAVRRIRRHRRRAERLWLVVDNTAPPRPCDTEEPSHA